MTYSSRSLLKKKKQGSSFYTERSTRTIKAISGFPSTPEGQPSTPWDGSLSILNSLDRAIWSVAANTFETLYLNPATEQIFNLKSQDFLKDSHLWMEKIYPEDRRKFDSYYTTVLSLGKVDIDYRIVRGRGEVCFLNNRSSVVCDETGKPLRIDTIVTDITAREQAEIERGKIRSLLSAVLEATADGILVIDREGTVKLYNQRFLHIWGLPGSIEGWGRDVLLPRIEAQLKNPEAFLAKVQELLQCPEKTSYEVLELKDGRTLDRYSQPMSLSGETVGRVLSFRDITAHVKAEAELERSLSLLQATLESTEDGILVSQNAKEITTFNQKFVQMWGLTDEVIADRDLQKLLPFILNKLKDPENFYCQTVELFSQAEAQGHHIFELKDGRIFERHSRPQKMGGKTIGRVCCLRDITERRRSELALKASEARFRRLSEATFEGIMVHDNGIILDANQALATLAGCEESKLIGMNAFQLLTPESQSLATQNMRSGYEAPYELVAITKDGTPFPIEVQGKALFHEGSAVRVTAVRDITQRKAADAALRKSEATNRALLNAIPDLMFRYSADGTYLDYKAAKDFETFVPPSEFLGRKLIDVLPPEVAESFLRCLQESLRNHEISVLEYQLPMSDILRDYEARFVPISTDEVLCIVRDISDRKQMEVAIRYQATHDSLTGLPNRTLFNEYLATALTRVDRQQTGLAVYFLDLDRFKTINDTLGHFVGDQLLVQVAKRIQSCLGPADLLARWGGDEFTLLISNVNPCQNAEKTATQILEALRLPFVLEEHSLHISASIGIALYPSNGEDAATLLSNADAALYRAKDNGRNHYQFYDSDINCCACELLILENALHQALNRGEFVVHYQPQVNTNTGRIAGMEALVRWQHPDLGLVPPATFIPLAEETGLIVPIGEWVLKTACQQNQAWQQAGLPPVRVAVNLSARQFQQPHLAEVVAKTLQETGLNPKYLELEITETVAMQNAERTKEILTSLEAMGVHLSIDDFGTGYSSLGYLREFPLHALKIDKSFVGQLNAYPQNAAIIKAVLSLGKGLNLRVIAEGVETEAQKNELRSLSCVDMQGYLFSRPQSPEDATRLLRNCLSRRVP